MKPPTLVLPVAANADVINYVGGEISNNRRILTAADARSDESVQLNTPTFGVAGVSWGPLEFDA